MIDNIIRMEQSVLAILGEIQEIKKAQVGKVEMPPVIGDRPAPPKAQAPLVDNNRRAMIAELAGQWIFSTKSEGLFDKAVYNLGSPEYVSVEKVVFDYFMNAGITEEFGSVDENGTFKVDEAVAIAIYDAHFDKLFDEVISKCMTSLNRKNL